MMNVTAHYNARVVDPVSGRLSELTFLIPVVSLLNVESLGEVFRELNLFETITPAWGGDHVDEAGDPFFIHSSFSVGDMITTSDGRVFRCDAYGWSELSENGTVVRVED